jgi:hypothetical protein
MELDREWTTGGYGEMTQALAPETNAYCSIMRQLDRLHLGDQRL